MASEPGLSPIVPVALVGAIGLACTLILFDRLHQWETGLDRTTFQLRASGRVDAIEHGLQAALSDLYATAGLFNALQDKVSPQEFQSFGLSLLARTPLVHGLTFYRHVADEERDDFERARQKDFPGYRIRELRDGQLVPAARRPSYRVIDMIVPFKPFERAHGVDADSVSSRFQPAIREAAIAGVPYTTRLFDMVADAGNTAHTLMLLPLYRGQPVTDAQREDALYGWVSSVLRASDLLDRTEPEQWIPGYHVELFTRDGGSDWQLVHAKGNAIGNMESADAAEFPDAWHGYQRTFKVAEREWRVSVSASRASLFETHLASLLVLLVGVVCTLPLCAYLYQLLARSRKIETLVGARTMELNHVNAMLVSDIAVREAQNRILHIIASGQSQERILDEIIAFSELRLAGARCMFVLLQPEPQQPRIAAPNLAPELAALIARLVTTEQIGWLRAAMNNGRANLRLADLRKAGLLDAGWALLKRAGLSVLSAWPVLGKNQDVLGVFVLMRAGRNPVGIGDGAVVSIATDLAGIVIESRRTEDQIRHLAHHDELTGLPNRALFTEHLQKALNQAKRNGAALAVLFIDLDRFKNINDTFGHNAGDEVLRCLAISFRSCLRTPDTIARLGGDEFIVLVENHTDSRYLGEIAERLLNEASKPFEIAGQECHLGASIGIAVYPGDGADASALVKNADVAMYRAKTIGRGNYQFFSPEMNTHTVNRLALESSLRRALERNEIVVHYQPKVDVRSGRILGAEALVRWQPDNRELMLPASFVPFAEEIGLISTIGMRVLDIACIDIRKLQQAGIDFGRVAINLSGLQFNDARLVQDVRNVIDKAGVDPHHLEFEITESMVMHNRERAVGLMSAIRSLGMTLSIDDFGTGYSSLASLRQFPVNSVKIDKSFIDDIADPSNGLAIVHAIIAMGHSLGLRVTAEGVETARQLEVLRRFECDEYQGYLFGPAMPVQEFIDFVSRRALPTLDTDHGAPLPPSAQVRVTGVPG